MKSFLSLERSATFTCRKDGVERVYLVYEGEEFVNYDLLTETPTNEENGVKAELIINGHYEKAQFISKARQKLAYYDTAVLVVDGNPEVWDIYRNELFQKSTANSNGQMHLCLKDVYYSIDWEALGIRALSYPIALRFGLDSGIIPTPSRESYITNEKTKKLIMDRIVEVAEWMVKKYNETVKEFDTFKEAYPYLTNHNPSLYLDLGGGNTTSFSLSPLSDYSTTKPLRPKVKGIKMRDAHFYRDKRDDLFYEFLIVGYINHSGNFRTKGWNGVSIGYHYFSDRKMPVIVNDGLKGNVREYLKEKYGKNTLFVRVNPEQRKLGTKSKTHSWTSYTHILDLHIKNKKDWRAYIDEWKFVRDQLQKDFIDERGAESTKEYEDWLEERKKLLRSKRKAGIYKGLNKQAGDVTLSYINTHKRGTGWQKAAYSIGKLVENRYLTVLIEDDDLKSKELAKKLHQMMGNDKVRFATVGKKEMKKIPEHFQFINFQKFMTRDCKPFMRLASALVFDKALEDFYKISRYKNGIFQNCLAGLLNDSVKLKEYVDKNMKFTGDDEVREYVLAVADEHKLYDFELWDVYTRLKEGTKKYDFIVCLAEPRIWDEEEQKRYNKTISQLLLFRKLYYNDLPEDAEIVFNKKQEEVNV